MYYLHFRPIIQENTAQQLGMDISLLERYSKNMEMLDTQYRMVSTHDNPNYDIHRNASKKLLTIKIDIIDVLKR